MADFSIFAQELQNQSKECKCNIFIIASVVVYKQRARNQTFTIFEKTGGPGLCCTAVVSLAQFHCQEVYNSFQFLCQIFGPIAALLRPGEYIAHI